MTALQELGDDIGLSRHEYDETVVFAADFGPGQDASVDVLGDTVMVVVGDEQYDLEIAGDARAFMKNGVLTIEVER